MPTAREERIALNETMFRTANERVAAWEERDRPEAVELYFCECANPDCRDKVPIRNSDYQRVRSNSDHFFVVPGHEISDAESVIELHESWALVEKDDGVREIVEATDLRRP